MKSLSKWRACDLSTAGWKWNLLGKVTTVDEATKEFKDEKNNENINENTELIEDNKI